jgi:hypothetical protein
MKEEEGRKEEREEGRKTEKERKKKKEGRKERQLSALFRETVKSQNKSFSLNFYLI